MSTNDREGKLQNWISTFNKEKAAVPASGHPALDVLQPPAEGGGTKSESTGWVVPLMILVTFFLHLIDVCGSVQAAPHGPLFSLHQPLQSRLLCSTAATVPHRHAGAENALHNTSIESSQDTQPPSPA